MTKSLSMIALFLIAASSAFADVKSGLQPGERPPAYYVEDATGPYKGKELCYRCKFGGRPVVNVFTRELNDSVAKLIKGIDQKVAENSGKQMKAFVVLLTDDPKAERGKLQQFAKTNGIKHTPLTTFGNPKGPSDYKISKDAAVTVMMWNKSRVKTNHAFSKASLADGSISAVVADAGKIAK